MSLRNNPRGFTLVEVLIAMVILATGVLLIIESMGRSQQAIRIAENLVQASLIMDQKLTESEMEVHDRHKLHFGNEEGKERFPGKEFQWSKATGIYSHPSIKDQTKMNQIDVSVKWKEGGLRKNELHLESLILNREKKQ